jgi:hypothetical protein
MSEPKPGANTSVSDQLLSEAGLSSASANASSNGENNNGSSGSGNSGGEADNKGGAGAGDNNNSGGNESGGEGAGASGNEQEGGGEGGEKKKVEPKPAAKKEEKPEPKKDDVDELTDDLILKALKKKTGKEYKSLDELLNPKVEEPLNEEQRKALAEEKKEKALKFCLDNKIFSKKDYDAYSSLLQADKVAAVKEEVFKEWKAADPALSDGDLEERFELKYGINEDKDTWLYTDGQARLDARFNKIVSGKYGKVIDMEIVFDTVQSNVNRAQVYKTQVDEVFEKEILADFEVVMDEKEEPFKAQLFTKEALAEIKESYLNQEMMNALMGDGQTINRESLIEEVKKDLVLKNLPIIIAQVAKSYADKKVNASRMARKGIKPENEVEIGDGGEPAIESGGLSDQLLEEASQNKVI